MAKGTQIAQAYIQIVPVMENVTQTIKKELNGGEDAGRSFGSKLGSGISKSLGAAVAGIGTLVSGAVAGIGALGKQSLDAYADFEQLTGGVETLFGTSAQSFNEYLNQVGGANLDTVQKMRDQYKSLTDAQNTVFENAQNAFKTSGLSANEYMETVTSFSASLIASLDGDTKKAAEQADKAIVDMSDNANKMGSSMESIQNAYQGFAKQNYTMLDNLKLGYGGTKSEMERLLQDAGKIAGVKFNIDSYSDVVEAIHVMQVNMGIAGTTAKEAEGTISGSLSMLKSSWENLLTAFGTGDSNMISRSMEGLFESINAVSSNIVPRIQAILPNLVQGLTSVITQLIPQINPMIMTLLPVLIDGASELVQNLVQMLPSILQALSEIVPYIVDAIVTNLPLLLEAGIEILLQLAQGITTSLPTLIPTIVDVILNIVDTFINNVDAFVDAGIQLMVGLSTGLVNAMPKLVEKAPTIIVALVAAFARNAPKLLQAAVDMVTTIAKGLINNIPKLISAIPEMVDKFKSAWDEYKDAMMEIGSAIVESIKSGISNAWEALSSWVAEKVSGIVNAIKERIAAALGSGEEQAGGEGEGGEGGAEPAPAPEPNPNPAPAGAEAQNYGHAFAEGFNKGLVDSLRVNEAIEEVYGIGSAVGIESGRRITSSNIASGNLANEIMRAMQQIQVNTNVVLEGDAGKLFRSVQNQDRTYRNITGRSAFA